jgi:hypothetical protein
MSFVLGGKRNLALREFALGSARTGAWSRLLQSCAADRRHRNAHHTVIYRTHGYDQLL